MWSDNETNRDFLNFRHVADTVAEMITQARGKPLSIGISGGWGVGKSSMVKLIEESLRGRKTNQYLFINFNAWLYQGYDDARAALMEVIAQALVEHGENTRTGLDKAKELLGRVNWVRAASLTATTVLPMAFGLPPLGVVGDAIGAFARITDGEVTQKDRDAIEKVDKKSTAAASTLLNPKQQPKSPPRAIHDLREQFKDTLQEMKVTLVVLIDDLDRCLPPTAIATLEAIRLFLFMEHTAFIIAADDKMIRRAVRAHFKNVDLDDDLVTSYFDKLIQVPIRVPPLGTQDVRAYLMLLFIENSTLPETTRDELRAKICQQLGESWQGKRVDREFVTSLIKSIPDKLAFQLDLADRLAPLMTTAKQISGNPRLIKRFLNTLDIRITTARAQHVTIDESVLAKMLLFERCGAQEAYARFVTSINDNPDGKPLFIKEWEEQAQAGKKIDDLSQDWDSDFTRAWLALPPALADADLRSAVYVSREHLPIITAADQLSSEGKTLLAALLELKGQAHAALTDRVKSLPRREITLIMDRVLDRARQTQDWGMPPILHALLSVVLASPDQGERLATFLRSIPVRQLRPAIVPAIAGKQWSGQVFEHWIEQEGIPGPVRKAIQQQLNRSN